MTGWRRWPRRSTGTRVPWVSSATAAGATSSGALRRRAPTASLTRSIPAQAPTSPVTLDDDRRFGVPVTLLMGSLDEATLRAELARWGPYAEELAAIDDATVVRLGTGHWPQFSAPAALARALVEAFAEVAPREDAPA